MTVREYKVLDKKIAAYMGYEVIDMTAECCNCGEVHRVGSEIMYSDSYSVFCDNKECGEGYASHHTVLEPCWWDEFAWDENSLDFHSNWNSLLPVIKKLIGEGHTARFQDYILDNDIYGAYKLVIELI